MPMHFIDFTAFVTLQKNKELYFSVMQKELVLISKCLHFDISRYLHKNLFVHQFVCLHALDNPLIIGFLVLSDYSNGHVNSSL